MKFKNSPSYSFFGTLTFLMLVVLGCTDALPTTLFTIVPNAQSGLDFNNRAYRE